MLPQWIIEKKRDGLELDSGEIAFFIEGYARGAIPEYQMAALAMAIAIRGMTRSETVCLTKCMLASGIVLDTSSAGRPRVDKHSTGGTGDKISLVLAPLAASCSLAVPMIAGRGLGSTGGTLDKLEAIPGFRVNLEPDEFVRIVAKCGCAIAGASDRIAPADRKLYALRDVTGTVPSVPLIAASILSKKLAAGLDAIVFDVKWGSGAFMGGLAEARALAETLVEVSSVLGLRAEALVSDMNQPLGCAVGNALEVAEAVEVLRGGGPADVRSLVLALGERMLALGGVAAGAEDARRQMERSIASGAAMEKFREMVALQGGNPAWLDAPAEMMYASVRETVKSPVSGRVRVLDAGLIGRAAVALGAGRTALGDAVDHSAGIICCKKINSTVERGEPLAYIHAGTPGRLASARKLVEQAFAVGDDKVEPPVLVAATCRKDKGALAWA